MTNKTVMIDAADAVSIASLITAAATKTAAQTTPVLGEIEVSLENGNLTATATDRFMAATYTTAASSTPWSVGDVTTFRLTAAAAKFLTANVKRVNKHYDTPPVEFVIDQDTRLVTISHGGATFSDTWISAKFPAVLNLINEWQPADTAQPVKLRGEFLARLYKFTDSFIRVDYWVLELGSAKSAFRLDRPGPVLATAGKFRVMIQPNIYQAGDTI
tara:strand:+ start:90 stop:737 length:648 start_codon:yes stop_codon:yes gene_type:complete